LSEISFAAVSSTARHVFHDEFFDPRPFGVVEILSKGIPILPPTPAIFDGFFQLEGVKYSSIHPHDLHFAAELLRFLIEHGRERYFV